MTLNLTPEEQAWLEEYRQELRRRYPGIIADLRLFDSREQKKSRPQAHRGRGRPPPGLQRLGSGFR